MARCRLRLKLVHFLAQGLARFGLSVGIRGANGLLEKSPQSENQVSKFLEEANGFQQTGRIDLAIKRYDQALELDPNNTNARRGEEEHAGLRCGSRGAAA